MKLHELDARELAWRLARRELSALELTESFLERIAEREAEVQAWACFDSDAARRHARALDAGAVRGALHGLPVGVKDVFDTAELPTEYGTPIYRGHQPAWDAACVASARAAGAVLLGKTVSTELATFTPTGKTVNPYDPARTPGGSSSGSAAAVAARMVPFAYGTQTVGSIIRPAAYCGVVGYKPSFGLLARAGLKLSSESLDTVGAFANSVTDAALLVSGSGGPAVLAEITPLERPRLGLCRSPVWSEMEPEAASAFEEAAGELAAAGASVVERELPGEFSDLMQTHGTILAYEAARCFAHELACHRGRMSDPLVRLLDEGGKIPVDHYARALRHAECCRGMLLEHARDLDVLVTPSATGEAPLGLSSTGNTAMNRIWTLLHGPCVTVPMGRGPAGMPLGIQFVGLPGGDGRTLAVAAWAERALG